MSLLSTSPFSPLLGVVLIPLSLLYGAAVRLRLTLYRVGILRSRRAAAPVISVGNLTVGGSGKSPVVEYLLREAKKAGVNAVSISRGYGRKSRAGLLRVRMNDRVPASPEVMGDEPYMLAWRNPAHAVYVGRNRVQAARLAEAVDRPQLIVLDDGYQHLRLARDLNVLLIDAERGLGNGHLLPWGVLREPLSALERADVVLLTKSSLGEAEAQARRLVARQRRELPVFSCDYRASRLTRLDGKQALPLSALQGQAVSLICAIAQPEGFSKVAQGLGASVEGVHAFRDHHPYGPRDLAWLDGQLAAVNGNWPCWLTTDKDAVKLRGRLQQSERLWVLEMEVIPEPAAAAFFFDFLSGLQLR